MTSWWSGGGGSCWRSWASELIVLIVRIRHSVLIRQGETKTDTRLEQSAAQQDRIMYISNIAE
jgi:hypothetical protein